MAENAHFSGSKGQDYLKYIQPFQIIYNFMTVPSSSLLNPLTPNDLYISRTAPLTSKSCILYINSTNEGTEYFKHALYSPFFLFKIQFVS